MGKSLKVILNSDFRSEDNRKETQKWLKKIKIIAKNTPEGEDVPFDVLDKLLVNLLKKYPITMQWISLTVIDNELPWYSVSFKDSNTHEWLGSFHGMTMYELYCKAVLFCYGKIKSSKGTKNE